jgi:DNA modification methylase
VARLNGEEDKAGEDDQTAHSTQKPVELYRRPYLNHTVRGDLVYEPFSGSGTAIAASEVLGRKCLAMELEPRYVQQAIQRWEKLTGGKAKRLDG